MLKIKNKLKQNKQTNKQKNKSHIYAAYKRLILDLKAPANWKWENGDILNMHMDVILIEAIILLWDKLDFKTKTKKRWRRIRHYSTEVYPIIRSNTVNIYALN